MAARDVIGGHVYAQLKGVTTEQNLFAALRAYIPGLINCDPDYYRTVKEQSFDYGFMILYCATGQKRNGDLFWAVMAIGSEREPPAEYQGICYAVGSAFCVQAAEEGEFD